MTPIVVLFLIGYAAILFQTTAGLFLQAGFVRVDMVPAIICWFSLRQESKEGVLPIALFGFLAANFSTIPEMVFPVSYLVAFSTVRYIVSNILELSDSRAYLITGFLSMEIIVIQLVGSGIPELVWPWGLIQSLFNAVIAPVVMYCCNATHSFLNGLENRRVGADNG